MLVFFNTEILYQHPRIFQLKGKGKYKRRKRMAGESPFEKEFVEESAKTDLASVLDQLNLPPAFIEYVRVHQKTIKIVAIIIVIAVITWSLYDSYRTKRVEKSGSALYTGMLNIGEEQKLALDKVVADYKGTPASTWAQVELGHAAMKDEQFSEAAQKYMDVRDSVKITNPIFPLVTYGVARALEAQQKYADASVEYERLKNIEGFKQMGTLGIARILEIQGQKEEALKIYEEYLSLFDGEQQNSADKILIEEKIARIRSSM